MAESMDEAHRRDMRTDHLIAEVLPKLQELAGIFRGRKSGVAVTVAYDKLADERAHIVQRWD